LSLLISETDRSLFGQRVLVLGLGRIGKATAVLLSRLGADFAAAAFTADELAAAPLYAADCFFWGGDVCARAGEFDVIINTVPKRLFGDGGLACIRCGATVIDAASAACLDGERAVNFRYLPASGLPQRFSRKSAAGIMKALILEKP
jgi:dipicolinate synthase subunit A